MKSQRIGPCLHFRPLYHHPWLPTLVVCFVTRLKETELVAVVAARIVDLLDGMSAAVAKPFEASSRSAVAKQHL